MPKTYWARTDSNSANNPALNLTGDGAVEITFVPFGANGDILLEYNGGGFDPDTQVEINGTAYNFTFQFSGTLPTTNNQGANQVPAQYRGSDVYLITVQDYPSAGTTTRVTFLPNELATEAEMNSFGNGAIRVQNLDTTTPGVICFASGTLLATPKGERPVDELRAGDLVVTADHGAQPILWAGKSDRHWPGCSPDDLPILIKADAIGGGLPVRDLVVSPQHKLLVPPADRCGAGVLAPVKGMTALAGVRRMNGKRQITYHHILFGQHEIVFAEGIACESFYPGQMAMRMLPPAQRREVLDLLPALKDGAAEGYGPPARPALTVGQTADMAAEAGRDAQRLFDPDAALADAAPARLGA
ncbi:MAG: Hint domain-containing protein [Silicimonas sp.]|nr:Hint domain-containing protein [Silicimonas sp.]